MLGKITGYDGENLHIMLPFSESDLWFLERQLITEAEVKLLDGRLISGKQRKKAYALLRDISLYTGYIPEEIKELMKVDYIASTGEKNFSLSNCDITTARRFIDHLVELCVKHGIPCQESLLERCEDIGRYLYLCLVYRKCCICGQYAHIHHVDRLGMGADRTEVCHVGYEAMALCAIHHNEAHNYSKQDFNKRYCVFGIKLDEFLCNKWRLGRKITTIKEKDNVNK